MNILILNCFSRNALAVINSLDTSYKLFGGVTFKSKWRNQLQKSLFASNRLNHVVEYTNPTLDQEQFYQDLLKLCQKHQIDAIFPTGTTSTNYLSFYKARLAKETSAVALVEDYDKFEQLTDKWETYQHALKAGVPVPKTILLKDDAETLGAIEQLQFPVIAKPRISFASHGVRFFNHFTELKNALEALNGFKDPAGKISHPYIIQEVIQGALHDVSLCAKSGQVAMMMSQQRIMSLRDFGGGGIINLTTYEPEMMQHAEKLVQLMQWNGPALFDFIKTNDNQYYLLEVNPKIWGTTRLMVEAGLNLPQALIDLFVLDKPLKKNNEYEKNLLYKWVFPECMAAFLLPPLSPIKIAKRIQKSLSKHQSSRSCTNLNRKDWRHLIGTILEKS